MMMITMMTPMMMTRWQVSNEIINRCRASISMAEILDGDVQLSMQALAQSIAAGDAWRSIYDQTEQARHHHPHPLPSPSSSPSPSTLYPKPHPHPHVLRVA